MRFWALFVLALFLVPGAGAARCLAYKPSSVSLVGHLDTRTLPGPPNYTNIARGDYPEVVLILTLETPVCVSGDPLSTRNSKSHSGVSEVQLSIPLSKARAYLGKRVRATGSLVGAHTGHHRTPVLLQVSGLRAG